MADIERKGSKKKKSKNLVEKASSKKENDGGVENVKPITIDLEVLLTPISIVLAGILVSVSILIGSWKINGNIDDGAVAGVVDSVQPTPTAAVPTEPEENPDAKTVVNDDDPYLGDKSKAKIAIVEYSDFECPFCDRFYEGALPSIIEDYVESGKAIFVYKHYPLSFHPTAEDRALASECARTVGGNEKFFEMHDLLFENLDTYSNDNLSGWAKDIGVDVGKFNTCFESRDLVASIKSDMSEGSASGVTGTPGFVIGVLDKDGNVDGELVAGALPYEQFKPVLDSYLEN